MHGRVGYLKKSKVGVCIMCRKPFQCARLDKKTCSDKCRKAWQRYNESVAREVSIIEKKSSQLDRLMSVIDISLSGIVGTRS